RWRRSCWLELHGQLPGDEHDATFGAAHGVPRARWIHDDGPLAVTPTLVHLVALEHFDLLEPGVPMRRQRGAGRIAQERRGAPHADLPVQRVNLDACA